MPQVAREREQRPPGGSSYAGTFHKDAFASHIYPKVKGIFPLADRRTERAEHKFFTHEHPKMFASNLAFGTQREPFAPSRLRKAVDTEAHRKATAPPTLYEKALMAKSSSVPDLSGSVEPQSFPIDFSPTPPAPSQAASSKGGDMAPTTRWYPHPTLLRGELKICERRAFDWGYDSDLPGYRCPFWEAEVHRFGKVASHPEARPRTPTKSLRWREEDAWSNPANHTALKVTQSIARLPREPS